jgi:hypothetical protein
MPTMKTPNKHENANSAWSSAPCSAAPLTLEQAITRYTVVSEKWGALAADNQPYINAFLAGWCSRGIGMSEPSDKACGIYRASFRAGWREADTFANIWQRQQNVEMSHE